MKETIITAKHLHRAFFGNTPIVTNGVSGVVQEDEKEQGGGLITPVLHGAIRTVLIGHSYDTQIHYTWSTTPHSDWTIALIRHKSH